MTNSESPPIACTLGSVDFKDRVGWIREIAGCFAFWAWLRLGRSALWVVPGMVSLALFAFC
jgi:hypothetical protein